MHISRMFEAALSRYVRVDSGSNYTEIYFLRGRYALALKDISADVSWSNFVDFKVKHEADHTGLSLRVGELLTEFWQGPMAACVHFKSARPGNVETRPTN